MNCQNCEATGTIQISFNSHQHGKDETYSFCVGCFVLADQGGQILSGVGIEMDCSAELELTGYFG